MSNVRLSNGSPTLERVEARQTEHTKPPIRRNLFGSEYLHREEQSVEFSGKMQDAERAFIERWNYDVSNDRPLSPGVGNCQWEAVKSTEVPPFYSRPPHRRGYPGGEVDLNGNDSQQRSRGDAVTGSQQQQQLSEDTERSVSEDTGRSARTTGCNGPRRRPGCPSPDSPSPPKRFHSIEDEASESEAGAEKSDHSFIEDGNEDDDDEEGDVSAAAAVVGEKTPRRPADSRT